MFVTVIVTAIMLKPDLMSLVEGIFLPSIPQTNGDGLAWTIALIGGVGGTVTILCYGYWIREEKRIDISALRNSPYRSCPILYHDRPVWVGNGYHWQQY